jgi:hypothetical protein
MAASNDEKAPSNADKRSRRTWVNWALALLTVPGAALVMLFSVGAVMGTAGCSDHGCRAGPGDFWFRVLFYGAAVVAALTIAISFYTATRKRGILVPLCGWALLAADAAILAISFRP